ncbi:MAG: alpha/beta hydrolase [Cytophagaceae bacterium SCN 52-12]|nr:MAG: alpha/beta hydrolase [Cytophagaceae bacterium SCN 52-12]
MEPDEQGFCEANGISLYYETYGQGRPLVLVHGGGSSFRFDYRELAVRLRDRYRLIGIDLQNHGRSGHRQEPETFEQDARDVIAVVEKLGIAKAFFMGFSNGGNTVMQIAHLSPAMAEKLIVASSFYKREGMADGFFEGMNLATIDFMPQVLKENFLSLNPDQSALMNMFEKDSRRMIGFRDWDKSVLRQIKAQVLFIAGDRDVMKAGHVAEMCREVPGARLMILPAGHGHYMMADESGHTDQALIDFTAAQICRFLDAKQPFT